MAVIGSMVAILLHERNRAREIEANTSEINSIRQNVTTIHRQITSLATQGESVLGWDDNECRTYHLRRLSVDSLLLSLKENCSHFVQPDQIDTLRMLLAAKESHLLRIMQSFRQREAMDSLIVQPLPTGVKSASKPRIEIRRKKGIAGFFGKKDTIRVYPPSRNLRTLDSQINTLRDTTAHI